MVTSVIIRELDKHKSSNSRRKRKRAQDALRFLENANISGNYEISQNVRLHFERPEPNPDTLDKNNLSASVPDDILIAKAIEFAALNQSHTVAVVSGDFGVRLKARGVSLCVPILDDYRLDPETDPLVKENQKLRNELLRLQNRQPNLTLGFFGANDTIERHFRTVIRFHENLISEDQLNQKSEDKRKELKYPRRHPSSSTGIYAVDYDVLGVTQEQVDLYREEVKEFLASTYRNYLYQNSLHRVFHISAVNIPLTLENTGSLPANGIEIALTISGVRAVLSGEPAQFDYPTSPVYPTARFGAQIVSNLGHSIRRDFRHNTVAVQGTASDLWTITTGELSTKVAHCYLDQLIHNKRTELDELFLIVDKPAKFPGSVKISFEIIAEDVIEKITGQLTVVIDEFAP